MILPLNDGTGWEVSPTLLQDLAQLYPQIDLDAELVKMKTWLICNPDRRKTRRGVKRFIGNWLMSAAERMPKLPQPQRTATCCQCRSPSTVRIEGAGYCDSHAAHMREVMGRASAG